VATRPTPERLTWEAIQTRLDHLADLLENLAEPADRGLTDDLWIAPGTFLYLTATVRDLSARCATNAALAEAGRAS